MKQHPLLALALGLALAGCGADARNETAEATSAEPPLTAEPAAPGTSTAQGPYDLRFIDTMLVHHDQGIQLAQLAAEKAESAELRAMAQRMLSDQQQDEAELRSWRDQWFVGAADAHDMSLPGASSMSVDMARLESASGAEFDEAFLELMAQHHEAGIAMARDAATNAEREELRRKAQEIADEQTRENEELRALQPPVAAG
jgi:uncharacterized protein (DUF305 family)